MELETKMETKLFSRSELDRLKNALPKKYKRDFERVWKNVYGKETPPSRQNIYAVMNGKSENDKILNVAIKLVEERNELHQELTKAINAKERQAQESN